MFPTEHLDAGNYSTMDTGAIDMIITMKVFQTQNGYLARAVHSINVGSEKHYFCARLWVDFLYLQWDDGKNQKTRKEKKEKTNRELKVDRSSVRRTLIPLSVMFCSIGRGIFPQTLQRSGNRALDVPRVEFKRWAGRRAGRQAGERLQVGSKGLSTQMPEVESSHPTLAWRCAASTSHRW